MVKPLPGTLLMLVLLTIPTVNALAGDPVPLRPKSDCMVGHLAEFGRYIGNWDIADSTLSAETGQWEAGAGAQWNFVCLGGVAIQDFWLPADGKVGSNLRTWNSEIERWDIAWTVTGLSGFAHIQAEMTDAGHIIMHWKAPVSTPPRRITFFPPDASGWDWKLEISQDDGKSWLEVYRIRATPSPE